MHVRLDHERITRCLLRETGRAAEKYAVRGWRQWRHLSREVKKLFNKVRSTRRAICELLS